MAENQILDTEARVCFNGGMDSNDTNQDTKTRAYPRNSAVGDRPAKVGRVDCTRCGGSGIFHTYGTCYRCGGQGGDPTERQWIYPTDWTDAQCQQHIDQREARNQAARVRNAERKQAELDAHHARLIEQYPILATLDQVRELTEYNSDEDLSTTTHESGICWSHLAPFMTDIYWSSIRYGNPTPKQIAALEKGWERELANAERQARWAAEREQEQANAQPVPEGRVEIEGEVVMRKMYDGQYGVTWKLMLKGDEGWRVFVTEPSSIRCEVGDRVRMTCTIEPAQDDPTFGKGKRPTKAEVL